MPRGFPVNPEKTSILRSIAAKNRVWTEEHKENVRNMLIKRNKSKKHIKKVKKSNTGVKFTEERKLNLRLNHADIKGEKNPRWNGGFYIHGYKFIYSPNHPLRNLKGYVREHLYVLYNFLGDKVKKSNIIHHIDGNKLNNEVSNLMIMKNHGSHRRIHCNRTKLGDILFNGTKLK